MLSMPRRKNARRKTAWWLDASLIVTVKEVAIAEGLKANRVVTEALEMGLAARQEQRAREQQPISSRELAARVRPSPSWDLR
jgi:hypothetical protein